MSRLSIVENFGPVREKRVLPRFPFNFLLFKDGSCGKTFAVTDISNTGMQLQMKSGEFSVAKGDTLSGNLILHELHVELSFHVKWVKHDKEGLRFGVQFVEKEKFRADLDKLLSVENICQSLRPLHREDELVSCPDDLKYWLQADGPGEFFVWVHPHGQLSRIQLIYLDAFIEWEDGIGLKTGKVFSKRDIETPLFEEDEFLFDLDDQVNCEKIDLANEFISAIPQGLISQECLDFIKLKIRQDR